MTETSNRNAETLTVISTTPIQVVDLEPGSKL